MKFHRSTYFHFSSRAFIVRHTGRNILHLMIIKADVAQFFHYITTNNVQSDIYVIINVGGKRWKDDCNM